MNNDSLLLINHWSCISDPESSEQEANGQVLTSEERGSR